MTTTRLRPGSRRCSRPWRCWSCWRCSIRGRCCAATSSSSADAQNADALRQVGDAGRREGSYPLWNPYLFIGMPTFGSLAYTPGLYPPSLVLEFLHAQLGLPPLTWMLAHLLLRRAGHGLAARPLAAAAGGAAAGRRRLAVLRRHRGLGRLRSRHQARRRDVPALAGRAWPGRSSRAAACARSRWRGCCWGCRCCAVTCRSPITRCCCSAGSRSGIWPGRWRDQPAAGRGAAGAAHGSARRRPSSSACWSAP